jgi:hypothetical protein
MRTTAVDDGLMWWRAEPAGSSTAARRQVLYLSGQPAPPVGRPRGPGRRNWIICRLRQVRQARLPSRSLSARRNGNHSPVTHCSSRGPSPDMRYPPLAITSGDGRARVKIRAGAGRGGAGAAAALSTRSPPATAMTRLASYWTGPSRGWLAGLDLPATSREIITGCLAVIDGPAPVTDRLDGSSAKAGDVTGRRRPPPRPWRCSTCALRGADWRSGVFVPARLLICPSRGG